MHGDETLLFPKFSSKGSPGLLDWKEKIGVATLIQLKSLPSGLQSSATVFTVVEMAFCNSISIVRSCKSAST